MLHPAIFEDTVGAGIVSSLGPAAWFRANTGITVTGLGVSQWDDQSGNARHLLQGTNSNRPIGLLHTGTNYLYLPAVSGNYASTPDSAAASVVGDIDLIARVVAADYTTAAYQLIIAKYTGALSTDSYGLLIDTGSTGKIGFVHVNGTTLTLPVSSVSAGLTDGAAYWIRATWNKTAGICNFYKADDASAVPSSWTQIGTDVVAPTTAMNDGSSAIHIGQTVGGLNPLNGKVYRAIVKSGIDGTTVIDFNPALATDQAATFVASTGETWTINSTGSKPAQIVARSSILFDGAAHFLKCSAFTLNQPETVFILFKQVSWTSGDFIFDGNTNSRGVLFQTVGTPSLSIHAGTTVAANANLTVGAYGAACVVFNGASSLLQVNNTTATTGNAGANNMAGFTLGTDGGVGGAYSNIQVLEAIIFPSALSTANIARVQRYLSRVGQLAF